MDSPIYTYSDGYVIIYDCCHVPQSIIDQIKADIENEKVSSQSEDIYTKQLDLIENKYPGTSFVAAFNHNKIYLGGVGLYITNIGNATNDLNLPAIEGIGKSIAGFNSEIKLNSLLIPAIETFLKEKGYNQIWVSPYPKQYRILQKYYGFTVDSSIYYPIVGINHILTKKIL